MTAVASRPPAVATTLGPLGPLVQRLLATVPVLEPGADLDPADLPDHLPAAAAVLLDRLVAAVHADPSPDRVWLLLVAVAGRYPAASVLGEARWVFDLEPPRECAIWLLAATVRPDPATGYGCTSHRLELVRGGVLVNVDHSAKDDLHTGVQRVVRSVLPTWSALGAVPVAWTDDRAGFRPLRAAEADRALGWGAEPSARRAPDDAAVDEVILVPWRSVVVVVEVDPTQPTEQLVPLAADSGNAMVGLGHDCIPVVTADMVPWGAAGTFARYLEVVKHMRRIGCVSVSAATEFEGFVTALAAQGAIGPRVLPLPLPGAAVPAVAAPDRPAGRPLVTAVGSFEPRKNHLALLHAAEVLWRAGHDFRLQLIGGMSWDREVEQRIAALQADGRPLSAARAVGERELAEAYATSRFTVFASLHEGYGLPLVESLAAGTPAITTAYGSTAETAAQGGALLVDPRDDGALTDAVRTLLVDDRVLGELRGQLRVRAAGSWADWAQRFWSAVVAPELADLRP